MNSLRTCEEVTSGSVLVLIVIGMKLITPNPPPPRLSLLSGPDTVSPYPTPILHQNTFMRWPRTLAGGNVQEKLSDYSYVSSEMPIYYDYRPTPSQRFVVRLFKTFMRPMIVKLLNFLTSNYVPECKLCPKVSVLVKYIQNTPENHNYPEKIGHRMLIITKNVIF